MTSFIVTGISPVRRSCDILSLALGEVVAEPLLFDGSYLRRKSSIQFEEAIAGTARIVTSNKETKILVSFIT
jgi:hypothetical protein